MPNPFRLKKKKISKPLSLLDCSTPPRCQYACTYELGEYLIVSVIGSSLSGDNLEVFLFCFFIFI